MLILAVMGVLQLADVVNPYKNGAPGKYVEPGEFIFCIHQ